MHVCLFTQTQIANRFKSHASGKQIQIYVERYVIGSRRAAVTTMHTLKSLQFILILLISLSLLVFSKTNSTSPFSHIKLKAPPRGTTFALTMSCRMKSKWGLVPLILSLMISSVAISVLQDR